MSYVIIQKPRPKNREELHTTGCGVIAAFARAETARVYIETLESTHLDLGLDYRVARVDRLPVRFKTTLDLWGWEFIDTCPTPPAAN